MRAPARVHIALGDLGRVTPRAYGGVGFAIAAPEVRVRVIRGAPEIRLPFDDPLTAHAVGALHDRLASFTGELAFGITVEALPAQHSGLGSKTALLLSIVKGVAELLGIPLTTEQMQGWSGRGGTSGVGVHSFFHGGVIWDGGHPQCDVPELLPSSGRAPAVIPPCLGRYKFPEHWRVCLIQPLGRAIFGEAELEIFRRATPIDPLETLATLGWISYGLIPAFATADLPALASSLQMLSTVGFKAKELAEQNEDVRTCLSLLHEVGAAAGMSSLGPTIFAIADKDDARGTGDIDRVAKSLGAKALWTRGQNIGAQVGAFR
ncbi:MAG: beta-ribofuranosylaminobenzene 5'-phosphate synthase family protein [Allosphingosinicella sp.]